MKLRFSPTSPYVRKVVVTAIETGLDDRIERVATNPWDPETDLGAANPLGKVPALITDDGDVLFDSPLICEFLDSVAGNKLLPRDGSDRWRVLRLQALADGMLDAAILRLLEGRRPDDQKSTDWMARQKTAIDRALDVLEGEAGTLGETPNAGSIAVGCALGYLDFRFGDDDWRGSRPTLAGWYAGFAERPSMQATIPIDPS